MTSRRIVRVALALTLAAALGAVGLPSGASLMADDVDDLDRELLEALEGAPPADSPERIIPRLIDGTQTAAQRIEAGQLDDETAALQGRILADIDALLKQSSPPGQPPQSQTSSDSPPQQDRPSQDAQSQENSQSQQDGQNDPNAASRESEQRTTSGQEGDGQRERRLGLSTSAWGHLPPKVREQMRSAFSEEYLPEYDALVRRYYEALARRRSDNSRDPRRMEDRE